MILLINTCSDKLSEPEFVRPIENILKDSNISFRTEHYRNISNDTLQQAEKALICGTALKDCDYLKHIDDFDWIMQFEKPVLGICAGFQILAKIFENPLTERTRIGRYEVEAVQENKLATMKRFHSYFLSLKNATIKKHFMILANSRSIPCMIKHETKEIYGCLFNPEVLNPEIITSFADSS